MVLWLIVGPIIALFISIGFTFWHTRKIRKENIQAIHKELYLEAYLADAEKIADDCLDICKRILNNVTDAEYSKLKQNIDKQSFSASRLQSLLIGDSRLSEEISKAATLLSDVILSKRFDTEKAINLKGICDSIKDLVAHRRYK